MRQPIAPNECPKKLLDAVDKVHRLLNASDFTFTVEKDALMDKIYEASLPVEGISAYPRAQKIVLQFYDDGETDEARAFVVEEEKTLEHEIAIEMLLVTQ